MFKKLIVASLIAMVMGKQQTHHKGQHHHHKGSVQVHTKTVTETVTHTVTPTHKGQIGTPIVYVTKTLECQPTETVDVTTTDVTDTTDTTSNAIDSQTECLSYFNKFRASQNLEPFEQATQEQINCANKAAVNDAQMGYHNSFYQRMCPVEAQCECLKGVNGGGLKNCIDAYISEGPPGTQGAYPQENHGHWNIIVGSFKYVACGTDGNGFYTHNFYN